MIKTITVICVIAFLVSCACNRDVVSPKDKEITTPTDRVR
jgi:hypothetical protein